MGTGTTSDTDVTCERCGASVSSPGAECVGCLPYDATDIALPDDPSVAQGRYRRESQIGTGGFCDVWRGTDTSLSAPVAINLLKVKSDPLGRQDAETRFRQQAKIMANLDHRNIVRATDFGRDDATGRFFMVSEWVDGPNLEVFCDREQRTMTPQECIRIAHQLLDALGYAHSTGVIHRDVTPRNVLLKGDDVDEVRLIDFGLARLIDGVHAGALALAADATPRPKDSNLVMGHPGFMAPEQRAAEPATARTDIHGVGAVMFFMLTRQAPFNRPGAAHGVNAPLTTADLPPSVPAGLREIVLKALAVAPADRYPTASHMREALSALERSPGGDVAAAHEQGRTVRRAMLILMLDIVGASKLSSSALTQQVERLLTVVCASLPLGVPPAAGVVRSTGDGVEVVVPADATPDIADGLVRSCIEIQRRLQVAGAGGDPFTVRSGLHVGQLHSIPHPQSGPQRVGLGLGVAARVMGLAGASQVIVSEEYYRELVTVSALEDLPYSVLPIDGPIEVGVRGLKLNVRYLCADGLSDDDPEALARLVPIEDAIFQVLADAERGLVEKLLAAGAEPSWDTLRPRLTVWYRERTRNRDELISTLFRHRRDRRPDQMVPSIIRYSVTQGQGPVGRAVRDATVAYEFDLPIREADPVGFRERWRALGLSERQCGQLRRSTGCVFAIPLNIGGGPIDFALCVDAKPGLGAWRGVLEAWVAEFQQGPALALTALMVLRTSRAS